MQYVVILVYSTTHALQIEKLLREHGVECKLIPVPRHLSSDCGICVRIWHADLELTWALLQESGIEYEGCYRL